MLDNLPVHNVVTLSFDLYVLGPWDGTEVWRLYVDEVTEADPATNRRVSFIIPQGRQGSRQPSVVGGNAWRAAPPERGLRSSIHRGTPGGTRC